MHGSVLKGFKIAGIRITGSELTSAFKSESKDCDYCMKRGGSGLSLA